MNITSILTTDYENKWQRRVRKNKPNLNPIKPNCRKGKIDAKCVFTKDYRKNDDFVVRINKPNFQKAQNECKLNYNRGLHKNDAFAVQKNKPNSNPISKDYLFSSFGFILCSHSGSCSRLTFSHSPFFKLRALASNCPYLL